MNIFSQCKILFLISRKNIAAQHFNFSYCGKLFYKKSPVNAVLRGLKKGVA
jgi:hypothetical protein